MALKGEYRWLERKVPVGLGGRVIRPTGPVTVRRIRAVEGGRHILRRRERLDLGTVRVNIRCWRQGERGGLLRSFILRRPCAPIPRGV